jgi:hypothetical protein
MTVSVGFQYDVFLSHDWGDDQYGRNNHARVSKINDALKTRGFRTWFDNDRMVGDIVAQMCDGVENSAVFVSFVTKRYTNKVASADDDNCKAEFSYAVRMRGTKNCIPVVMEDQMKSTASWAGPVGMRLGDVLYVSMWDNDISPGVIHLSEEITKRYPACKDHVVVA